ncbi:hypothetical protein D9Q98_003535 [Chlorella vulgaris]|uniref:Follistatin-like domain-containing protein n=1 Tax=Chlorella vulgaris TaxID=3077 RepID=A0A9D4YYL3_CHLVU|nr:hypothetical protein D9Q98_003535 [Chlorella vulgaris]
MSRFSLLGVACGLLLVLGVRARDGDADASACAAILCAVNTSCEVNEAGEPECKELPPNPCAATTCVVGDVCFVNQSGEGECKPDPCAATSCVTGTYCTVTQEGEAVCEPGMTTMACELECEEGLVCTLQDDIPTCAEPLPDACAAVSCEQNHACMVDEEGNAGCVPVETVNNEAGGGGPNPCAFTTCLTGTICVAEGTKARCISACSTVRCRSGTTCKVNSRGMARCVRKPPRLTCKTVKCKAFQFCAMRGFPKRPRCISKCARTRCPRHLPRCIISKKNRPVCVRPKRG